jgi:hypothetical protein
VHYEEDAGITVRRCNNRLCRDTRGVASSLGTTPASTKPSTAGFNVKVALCWIAGAPDFRIPDQPHSDPLMAGNAGLPGEQQSVTSELLHLPCFDGPVLAAVEGERPGEGEPERPGAHSRHRHSTPMHQT